MRLMLALGAAVVATTMIAHAQTEERATERTHIFIRHGGHADMDADGDGWLSRAESATGAERMFAELDRNDDGRLNREDRPSIEEFEASLDGPHPAPHADDENCTRTESGEGEERRVTIVCRAETSAYGERRIETRRQIIVRGDSEGDVMVAPVPPLPPVPRPPHAPMFMMMLGEDSEADINNDGALSLDEFRNQHLRMFDAHDVNGDGRVRAHRLPEPPTPPTPPAPPAPPARR